MLAHLNIGTRLAALPAVFMPIVAGIGMIGNRETPSGMRSVYEHGTQNPRRPPVTTSMPASRGRADAANGLLDAGPATQAAGEFEKPAATLHTEITRFKA